MKVEILTLRQALEASWRPETAYLNVEEEGNPALGQCYPTSRVIEDQGRGRSSSSIIF